MSTFGRLIMLKDLMMSEEEIKIEVMVKTGERRLIIMTDRALFTE